MGGWRKKARQLFSPRAIVAHQIGPNSFRYMPAKEPDYDKGYESEYDRVLAERGWSSPKGYKKNQTYERSTVYRSPELTQKKRWDEDEEEIAGWRQKSNYSGTTYWDSRRWSSYGGYSFVVDKDDDSDLFAMCPESYMTPTTAEIQAKSDVWEAREIKRVKEFARVCYLKMIDEKDYISERYKDPNNLPISTEEYQNKKRWCDNIYDTFIPGFTPLEQALAVNWRVREEIAKKNRGKGKDGWRDHQKFEFLRSDFADATINSQIELNPLSRERKLDIINKISIVGSLGHQFKVEKEIGEKEVHNSILRNKKHMLSYDQVHLIDMYQRVMPNFKSKFALKDLLVNVPVERSEKKQKIIIIVDFSGSMCEKEKQLWVNALLIDRFRHVIKGEAEVYFSFFVCTASALRWTHLKDEEDVIKFWKKFSNDPNGGLTDMGAIVKSIQTNVESGSFYDTGLNLSKERPEILIINDGNDRVGHSKFPYKVNAISLIEFSSELRDLCVASGGKQVEVKADGTIYTHDETGKKELGK